MTSGYFQSSGSEHLNWRDALIIGVAAIICAATYLMTAKFTAGVGYPLDDAWIHQTYAINLAEYGEWSFRPGLRSAGSTSPLWSILLSLGYKVNIPHLLWTNLLGVILLILVAYLIESAARTFSQDYRPSVPWVGIYSVFFWQFSWAAFSGMETILHILILTLALILMIARSTSWVILGLLTGLSVWIRPDGITLVAPAILCMLSNDDHLHDKAGDLVKYFVGMGALFLPYLIFNLYLEGSPWPNTFYAKQAEYISWQAEPLIERTGLVLLQYFAGSNLILIPGAVLWLYQKAKERSLPWLIVAIWLTGFVGIYTLRLPPYQHGRYLMPAMPIFVLFGLLGLIHFFKSTIFGKRHWFIQTLWITSLAITEILFILLGARAYSRDVAVIESEMVKTAKWAEANLPEDALIAAHDIGALGYFDDHELLDMAGLVSPEVIPFIRDETRLADYLNDRGADYLIAFPDFYPRLTKDLEKVYTSDSSFAPMFSQENMTIFRWPSVK
ncbi:MAG: hypothetical protein A2Y54_01755 [Chloroflexi bacterium RBG_16_51_16]|nr:MAG: hypothetical protein A2Y54_01755 [Chloroflexi bacterium RBG_16_51_16]